MQRHTTKGNFNQTLAPILFLLPNLVIFLLFAIIPALNGLKMSLFRQGVFVTPTFVGLGNFFELLHDNVFLITLKNTVFFSLASVLIIVPVAFVLALLLHKNTLKGESAYRAFFYIPSLLSMLIVGVSWRFLFGQEMGILNYLLGLLGKEGVPWLTNSHYAMLSVVMVFVWAGAGYYMVILIVGLQAIPTELYEAAKIDGAGLRYTLSRITIPLLKNSLLVVYVLATVRAFKAYELIIALTNGGPGYSTRLIVQQVYQVAFVEDRMGYSAAMSIVLMIILGFFTAIQFKFSGKEQKYE